MSSSSFDQEMSELKISSLTQRQKCNISLLCFQPPAVSPEQTWEEQAAVDSTTTLLHTHSTRDTSRMDGTLKP